MTDAEIDESAKYFAQQKLRRRVCVIESLRIPRAERAAWIYEEVGGTEDLEDRLLEVTNELARHERRDDRLEYIGLCAARAASARGKRLVDHRATASKTRVCSTCHLANLKGTDKIPPIAGRSPTYLLRQLLAFRNGTRAERSRAADDADVSKSSTLNDMIDVVAYVGSLYPHPRLPRRARLARVAAGERHAEVVHESRACRVRGCRRLRSHRETRAARSRRASCRVALACATNSTLASDTEDLLALQVHVVGIDQAPLGHDVEVQRLEARLGAVRELADDAVHGRRRARPSRAPARSTCPRGPLNQRALALGSVQRAKQRRGS